jgi:von Willebrand factor type A domain
MRWFAAFAVAVGLLVSASPAVAQGVAGDGGAGAQQSVPIRVRSELVLVPALVRDKSGGLVYMLSANSFVLTDDGVAQRLKLEEDTGGEPLALVVVMEAGAAEAAGWRPQSRDVGSNRFAHVATMVEAIVGGVKGRVAVVVFDGHPRLAADFTQDMDAVAMALEGASEEENTDGGAAILDSLGFAVDMLRKQPPEYRRAILLLSETNDRGSHVPIEQAIRAIGDTNTTIFSVAFASGKAAASNYGHKWLPTKKNDPGKPNPQMVGIPPDIRYPNTAYTKALEAILDNMMMGVFGANSTPYPPGGCFAKNGGDDEDKRQSRTSRTYDCIAQLIPPLAVAKMAAIAATDGMRTNVPKTVAEMTGGEYFGFNGEKSLEGALVTIANHLPNRYILSFQPHDPHPGIHALALRLPEYPQLEITARSSYWADVETVQH